MLNGTVWWSASPSPWWPTGRLGCCLKVCSHLIICCFLLMYRSIQFTHCIESLLHGSSLCTLLYISFRPLNREHDKLKRIGRSPWRQSVFTRPRLVPKFQLNVKHGRNFYACKRPSLSLNNTMINFCPCRSKRGVEKKADYPNIRDKRSLFSMLEKRIAPPGFKPEDKKWLNWVHVCYKLHPASSDRLCFINQVDVISCFNYLTNRIDNFR